MLEDEIGDEPVIDPGGSPPMNFNQTPMVSTGTFAVDLVSGLRKPYTNSGPNCALTSSRWSCGRLFHAFHSSSAKNVRMRSSGESYSASRDSYPGCWS